jgi:hypothetical protein
MQNLSINYPVFISVTLGLVAFGFAYGFLVVRKAAEKKVKGQTALFVVIGVAVTVMASSFVIGAHAAIILVTCFAASGAPMFYEYASRTHKEQSTDAEEAMEIARKLLG